MIPRYGLQKKAVFKQRRTKYFETPYKAKGMYDKGD